MAGLSTGPDQFCPRCGYQVGQANWCLRCGWRVEEPEPVVMRRLSRYMWLAFGSLALVGVIAIATQR